MKRYFTVIAIIALSLWSCSKDETVKVEDDKPTVPTYHFSIRASVDPNTKGVTFDAGEAKVTSQFELTDKIYVYNETKGAFARDASDSYNLAFIQPKEGTLSNNNRSCTLEGNLSFYIDNGEDWEDVTPESEDTYSLFYQMNDPNSDWEPNYDYTVQKGTAATASKCDFAIATNVVMTLSGTTLSAPEDVSFVNLQSMFRQRLTFIKESSTVNPESFEWLIVDTENSTLVSYYFPLEDDPDDKNYTDAFAITNPVFDNQYTYLSLSFYYPDEDSKDDKLILTAKDNEGNVYKCTKNVPTGGFCKNKYYHGDMDMVWQYQMIKPIVTRSDFGDEDELKPSILGRYYFSNASDPVLINIKGNSSFYYFYLQPSSSTVTLSENGVANVSGDKPFINNPIAGSTLTIELESDFIINCRDNYCAINGINLKLRTTGGKQQLTVTTNRGEADSKYGIIGSENYDGLTNNNPQALAADGFTVTRSAMIDNGDGTYTWTYTVFPSNTGTGFIWD